MTITHRRESTLDEAQNEALAFALEDETEKEKIPKLALAQSRDSSTKSIGFQQRPSPRSLTQGTGQSTVWSLGSQQLEHLQLARAQALALAMNNNDDSEFNSDDDMSLGDTPRSKPSQCTEKDMKTSDIVSQMHLGQNTISQDASSHCESTEFSISRRPLPASFFHMDTSKKRNESQKSLLNFTVTRRASVPAFICKANASSTHHHPEYQVEKTRSKSKSIEKKPIMEEAYRDRVSDSRNNQFQESSTLPSSSSFQKHIKGNSVQETSQYMNQTGPTFDTESQVSAPFNHHSRGCEMCRSHWIYLIILGAIAVAATSALVTVLLLRPDNIDSMDEVAEAASGNTAPEPERPLLQEGSVIAFVPEVICSAQVPGDSWSRLCTAEETAQHGGGACNLVARALLDQVPYADIGIQNAAFCVHDINTTESFTKKDARDFLPFHEMVRTVEVKGSTIGVMLEEVINSLFKTLESKGDYPYASGLRFNVNASASYGNRVTGIEVNERLEKGTWKPINNDGFYTIVGGMLIKGNDPFGAFEFAYRGEQTGKTVTETFIDYAIKARVLENPKPEEFSTQIYIP